ncbi:hypothetical protein [Halorussus halobius]|uniref:hypothetical protein n=1 Tax=Halorussus halobius TaxID=1710537 RepID=UPI001092BBD5|nr:hypothetical protein [Halorussus halobius]
MSTPERNFEIAGDDTEGEKRREEAIDGLRTANECDMLADLARDDSLADRYRRQAVRALGSPQCTAMLRSLVDDLDDELRATAERLAEERRDA